MIRAGFTPRAKEQEQDSWQQKLAEAVAHRRPGSPVPTGKVAQLTVALGPRGEEIQISYWASPAGARATGISYS